VIKIRLASPDDTPEMARVIVDTWFAAHKGQVSAEAFRRRQAEWGYLQSEQGWRRSIEDADGVTSQVMVATDGDQIVAVAASAVTGPDQAEMTVLYVDVPYQRSGTGRSLLEMTIDHYRSLGISVLHIAVLATNRPAGQFYENLGGKASGTRDDDDGLQTVYQWNLSCR